MKRYRKLLISALPLFGVATSCGGPKTEHQPMLASYECAGIEARPVFQGDTWSDFGIANGITDAQASNLIMPHLNSKLPQAGEWASVPIDCDRTPSYVATGFAEKLAKLTEINEARPTENQLTGDQLREIALRESIYEQTGADVVIIGHIALQGPNGKIPLEGVVLFITKG